MGMKYKLNAEQQKMVEQHLDLVSIIIRKYISVNEQVRGLEYEDLYQYGCLALCKAAYLYDGRVKFETFAGTVIRNALLDECRKAMKNYSRSLSYDACINADDDDDGTFAGMLGGHLRYDRSTLQRRIDEHRAVCKEDTQRCCPEGD